MDDFDPSGIVVSLASWAESVAEKVLEYRVVAKSPVPGSLLVPQGHSYSGHSHETQMC